VWEQKRVVRYYLHRWPSQRAMKRLRETVRDRTGANREGTRRAVVTIPQSSRASLFQSYVCDAPAIPPRKALRTT